MYEDMTQEEMFVELTKFFGGNKHAAAGLMGNFQRESGVQSSRVSGKFKKANGISDDEYTASVDDGTYDNFVHDGAGYGLAMFTYHKKKEGLLNLAKETGLSVGSTRLQVLYIEQELEDRPQLLEELKDMESAHEAAVRFMMGYEGPADQSDENQDSRGRLGEQFYDMYKNIAVDGKKSTLLEEIYMDIDKINDAISSFESKIKSINLSSVNIVSIFSPLTSIGIASGLISSLNTKIKEIENSALDTCRNIFKIADEQNMTDLKFKDTEETYYSRGGGYYRNGGSGYGGGDQDLTGGNTGVDNSTKNLNINTSFENAILTLDSTSYANFMIALASMSGGLLKYLETPGFENELKKALLDNPNLSKELKEIISNMDPAILRVEILALLGNDSKLSNFTKNLIYNYFNYTGDKSSLGDNLDKIINKIDKLEESKDPAKDLLDIYDGKDASSKEESDFLRLFTDSLAADKNVTAEELLTNGNNLNSIKNALADTKQTLSYLSASKSLGTNAYNGAVFNIIKGGMH